MKEMKLNLIHTLSRHKRNVMTGARVNILSSFEYKTEKDVKLALQWINDKQMRNESAFSHNNMSFTYVNVDSVVLGNVLVASVLS